MSGRPILDAGPALNFLATNNERMLIDALGPISMPEVVVEEILAKSKADPRFSNASRVWSKLEPSDYVQVLSDDLTPGLAAAVERIGKMPIGERMLQSKDLGELMVISHAAVQAEVGQDVIVLIDDGQGASLAQRESARLKRLRAMGREVGSIQLANTRTVLIKAAGSAYLPDRTAMRKTYKRLRGCDDGLIDISQTDLLSDAVWSRSRS